MIQSAISLCEDSLHKHTRHAEDVVIHRLIVCVSDVSNHHQTRGRFHPPTVTLLLRLSPPIVQIVPSSFRARTLTSSPSLSAQRFDERATETVEGSVENEKQRFFFHAFCSQHTGEYSISAVSGRYNGATEGFWQAHYSTSLPHYTPTHPNISSHYLIDLLAFVTKSCSRSPQSTSDRFPILDESKVESASIGADIGGVLQGKPAVTGLMWSCHCVVT
ncbi:uncharacterized protein V6R79_014799 [Siganus canaliculatus]